MRRVDTVDLVDLPHPVLSSSQSDRSRVCIGAGTSTTYTRSTGSWGRS
jgi:hypothetical protein